MEELADALDANSTLVTLNILDQGRTPYQRDLSSDAPLRGPRAPAPSEFASMQHSAAEPPSNAKTILKLKRTSLVDKRRLSVGAMAHQRLVASGERGAGLQGLAQKVEGDWTNSGE